MFKRFTAIIMVVFVLIISVSCKTKNENLYESVIEYSNENIVSSEFKNNSSSDISSENKTTSKPSNKDNNKPKSEKPIEKEELNTDEELEQPKVQKIDKITHTYGNHIPVKEEDYFQYSSLDNNKKSLYLKFKEAINNSQSIVNISKMNFEKDDVVEVYTKFLADHPQYFFISKSYLAIYNSRGDKIRAVVILYTDGETIDDFDDRLNLISTANRNIINQKISMLNREVENIVSKIPDDISPALKEKLIHDYVVNIIEYDYSVIEAEEEVTSYNSHSYDIYGALVEGLSVCEGYTKLFQYLCYNVGINSTQVFGEAEGDLHVWNAVEIDDKWYHTDLTWADDEDYISYTYYNLTTDEITKTHKILLEDLVMPECNSFDASFKNLFAISVEDTNYPPEDYKTSIDNIFALNENQIYIYIHNSRKDFDGNINLNKYVRYIQLYFSKGTEISNYLASMGLELDSSIYSNGEFIVIGLK